MICNLDGIHEFFTKMPLAVGVDGELDTEQSGSLGRNPVIPVTLVSLIINQCRIPSILPCIVLLLDRCQVTIRPNIV